MNVHRIQQVRLILLIVGAGVFHTDPGRAEIPEVYLDHGWLQEAAWAFAAAGRTKPAQQALRRLETVLRSEPVNVEPFGRGLAATYRLTFEDGSRALFKVDGSDPECAVCNAGREVAAYRIDQLLGFNLTPMTILRSARLPDGRVVNGSAMYFMRLASLPGRAGASKTDRLRLFDAVIGNSDRHPENWLVLASGRQVAIDHDRAFQFTPSTNAWTCWEEEIDLLSDIDALFDSKKQDRPVELAAIIKRYQNLTAQAAQEALADVLDPATLDAFLAQRNRVLDRLQQRQETPDAPLLKVACADRGR